MKKAFKYILKHTKMVFWALDKTNDNLLYFNSSFLYHIQTSSTNSISHKLRQSQEIAAMYIDFRITN